MAEAAEMIKDRSFWSSTTKDKEVREVPSQPLKPWPMILLGRYMFFSSFSK
jgi:hypothetical protein